MSTKTDIWAITRSNGPYTCIRAKDWREAMDITGSNPRISEQVRVDGGFAMHRLTTEEIPGLFRTFWGNDFWNSIPEENQSEITRLYLAYDSATPADPGEFLDDIRLNRSSSNNDLETPLVSAPRLHDNTTKTTLICPDSYLDDPVSWAIYHMLTVDIARNAVPVFFSCAEMEEIKQFKDANDNK